MRTDSYRMLFCWDEHFFILFSNIFILFSLVGRASSTIFASPHTQDCINSSDVKPTQCNNRLPTRERNALFKWPGLLLPVSEKCRSSQKEAPHCPLGSRSIPLARSGAEWNPKLEFIVSVFRSLAVCTFTTQPTACGRTGSKRFQNLMTA